MEDPLEVALLEDHELRVLGGDRRRRPRRGLLQQGPVPERVAPFQGDQLGAQLLLVQEVGEDPGPAAAEEGPLLRPVVLVLLPDALQGLVVIAAHAARDARAGGLAPLARGGGLLEPDRHRPGEDDEELGARLPLLEDDLVLLHPGEDHLGRQLEDHVPAQLVHEPVPAEEVGEHRPRVQVPLVWRHRQDLAEALRHEDDVPQAAEDPVEVEGVDDH